MNIKLGGNNIEVKIVYKNNQNIYMRFNEDAVLVITCPKNTLNDQIAELINENEESILRMYDIALKKAAYDNEFWYLGKKYNVILNYDYDEVTIKDDNIYAYDEKNLEDFIDYEIDRVFNEELELCKKCFNNLPEFKLKTRKMKTRWGVCNRRNNTVTLNTELIKKNIDIIDYVIIHELSHFYEGNHSKNFWNIVAKACPKYKKLRSELKK